MDNGTTLDETLIRDNLRKARNSRGLTQSKVAESLDISLTAYQKIESGKTRIINPHFTKCADTFGVSLSELVLGYEPVKDARQTLNDMEESYGAKMIVQEKGYLQEIRERDQEIERLKEAIQDKDRIIYNQELLIKHLTGESF